LAFAISLEDFQGKYVGNWKSSGVKNSVATQSQGTAEIEFGKDSKSNTYHLREVTKWRVGDCDAWAEEDSDLIPLADGLFTSQKKVRFDWCDGNKVQESTRAGFGDCRHDVCHIVYPIIENKADYFSEDSYQLTKEGLSTFGMQHRTKSARYAHYEGSYKVR